MFSYKTEWGRGNINAGSYLINEARYLVDIFQSVWYEVTCLKKKTNI